jgi:hypothetical protein
MGLPLEIKTQPARLLAMPTPLARDAFKEFAQQLMACARRKQTRYQKTQSMRLVRSRVLTFHPEVRRRTCNAILRRRTHTKAYRCHLTARGAFGCVMLDLQRGTSRRCGALADLGFCQHVQAMVLLLVRDGLLSPQMALRWSQDAAQTRAEVDREEAVKGCLRQLQAQAEEFDWRPGALIAEDLYAHICGAAHVGAARSSLVTLAPQV